MSSLRLDLDTTDFGQLVELGQSVIPTVAPEWTDHNIHDPGIMLMELVAWVADAEVYALARTSRAEREAYARVIGLELTGPRPAQGLIWPLAADAPAGAPVPWASGTVIDAGARAVGDRPQAPAFFTTRRIELTTAALTGVATGFADGSRRDWTRANSQTGATFLPFGSHPRNGAVLRLTLSGPLVAAGSAGAPMSVGFEIPQDLPPEEDRRCNPVRLNVSLADQDGPLPVSLVEDTTGGLSHSGVLLLDVGQVAVDPQPVYTLSIQSESGAFLLPPRVGRIALNVLPIEQIDAVYDERPFGTNMPGQSYTLEHAGLIYPIDSTFTVLLSGDGTRLEPWSRIDDLDAASPDEAAFALDEGAGVLSFGNGLNGRMPSAGATLRVDYRVTAGARGNLPRGIRWTVAGVAGPFGVNSEVTSGGSDAGDLAALRAEARRRVRHARPIVTVTDLEDAARAFVDLDVRRAQELPVPSGARRPAGTRVLVAVRPHEAADDGAPLEESAAWLHEIRRRLRTRLPLGQSLEVMAPRLVDVRVVAHVVAASQIDPATLRADIAKMLRARFAITATDGTAVWPFGRDVTAVTVKGWLRRVDGVARVVSASVVSPPSEELRDRVELGPAALPRLLIDAADLTIDRAAIGGNR
jgi:predicted phage baseplate assembly protein